VRCFERLIHPDWLLERQGSEWLLREPQAGEKQHGLLTIHGCKSLAFSLDKPGADPWPFLNSATHPGIRGICDALVLVQKEGRAYAIAIEMKTKDEGRAERQIENARLFLNWLFGLLDLHSHWRGQYLFCGVISFKPRRQERKGATARTPLPAPQKSHRGYWIFRLRNHPRLNLADVLQSLGETQ
jgi:hypothetical protein